MPGKERQLTEREININRGLRRFRIQKGINVSNFAIMLGTSKSQVSRIEHLTKAWIRDPHETAFDLGISLKELLAPCPQCNYRPMNNYTCNKCGTSSTENEQRIVA